MKHYRINYIDGHDLRYKSFETSAKSKEDAISKLWDRYDADFDHHIAEVIELPEAPSLPFRIGSVPEKRSRKSI